VTLPRVVVLAPVVPVDNSPHAGGRYLQILTTTLAGRADVTLVVPNTPDARTTRLDPSAPRSVIVADEARPTSRRQRAVRRGVAFAQKWLARVDSGLPTLSLGAAILRRGAVRDAVASADVVDLQWSESIRFAKIVRRVNPHARVVGTFHDVQSQLFSRRPTSSWRGRLRRRVAVAVSRHYERRAVALLDDVAVFSEKDALLLGDAVSARVIHPPLATGHEAPAATPTGPPTVVFVAHFARIINEDAARWLLRDVWPRVRDAVPDARLRLVGRDVSSRLAAEVEAHPGATAVGFVSDLSAALTSAHVAVAPLLQGAGVKFKTVEALLNGVPVVATSVGAEGIEIPQLFAGVVDTPEGFARAVVQALLDPDTARERAAKAQEWACRTYSAETFAATIEQAYGIA
jgi:glycosyltransferase involved in cell wall biosynthesis